MPLLDEPVASPPRPSETTSLLPRDPEPPEHAQEIHRQLGPYQMKRILLRIPYDIWNTVWLTLGYSYTNLLLPCVPLGVIAAEHKWDPRLVFTTNFLAMFPLASILTFSTEQLADKVGTTLGGLINASFGNAVELLVGLSALREGQIRIVQSSMIGSILSSQLLILGCCFFVIGIKQHAVSIKKDVAAILTSLMIISCASLVIPAALHAADLSTDTFEGPQASPALLALSRFTSVILLLFYVLYVFFQMVTHKHVFADASEGEEEEQDESKKLGIAASCAVLIASTLGVAFGSDYLIDSVDGFVESLGVSKAFVGLIIVPIVGNAGEFVATVQWSKGGKIDLAVEVIVGSTLQISLFVTPFLVLLGWILDSPMSLQFDTFETIVLTLSVIVVNCLVRDGSTNYFEGFLLISTYVIVAISFFVHPDLAETKAV